MLDGFTFGIVSRRPVVRDHPGSQGSVAQLVEQRKNSSPFIRPIFTLLIL